MSWEILNQFLVKEHLGIFKAANNFDIYDIQTGQQVLTCREENLGIFTKIFRFTDYKRFTPFNIEIRDMHGRLIVEISRGISLFLSKVEVKDANGLLIGTFKQKLFSIGGAFSIRDKQEQETCILKGKWTGWEFNFSSSSSGIHYAQVSKKWAGIGKELFTSADNYVISIENNAQNDIELKKLILSAVMCIDMVLKE
jgi:uncharacterized protein YxjI